MVCDWSSPKRLMRLWGHVLSRLMESSRCYSHLKNQSYNRSCSLSFRLWIGCKCDIAFHNFFCHLSQSGKLLHVITPVSNSSYPSCLMNILNGKHSSKTWTWTLQAMKHYYLALCLPQSQRWHSKPVYSCWWFHLWLLKTNVRTRWVVLVCVF